jgi:hypothetical protein
MGKRYEVVPLDKNSIDFKNALERGDPEAIEAEYADQNKVLNIDYEKHRQDKRRQVQYVVKWADTMMLNEHVDVHIEAYQKMGYTAIKKVSFGNTFTKVSWAPRAEPLINLKKLPNWNRLIADFHIKKINNCLD